MSDFRDQLTAALADRYDLERELGRGGMAVVYLAQDRKLGRSVALKVLHPELAATLGSERFLREIEIAANLAHPHILPLFDSGEAGEAQDRFLYYTMPYVEGESLRERLRREKQLPIDDAVTIADQVADALGHAHGQGIVHRDIKPENILFQGGHAVVSDFGIARAVTAAGGESLTQTGMAVGTPVYMSPEQGAGTGEVDARSDLYSLACVLYEMIGGEPPFGGPTPQAILARHSMAEIPSLTLIRPATPPAVEQAIAKALAKTPADRFSTAEQFRRALSMGDAPQPRHTPRAPAARKGLLAGVAVVVLAAAAVGLWRWWPVGTGKTAGPVLRTIAILPFDQDGDVEPPLDSASLPKLLHTYFGTVEPYRAAPLGQVEAAVARSCSEGPTRVCGANVASALGTQFYLTGLVEEARGDSVRIDVDLKELGGDRVIPRVTVWASKANPAPALSRLFRELVSAAAGEGELLIGTAGLDTDNLDALAAFVDGELYFMEFAEDSAIAAFRRATGFDSTFALAWYRLAVLYESKDWVWLRRDAIARARRFSERLSNRDLRMLDATHLTAEGYADSAEAILDSLIVEDANDVEALFQLGFLQWAYNWRRGRPTAEAGGSFGRVLELHPRHRYALIHQRYAVAASGDVDALDSLAVAEPDDDGPRRVAQTVRAHRAADSALLRTALDSLVDPDYPPRHWYYGDVHKIVLGTIHGAVPDLSRLSKVLQGMISPQFSPPFRSFLRLLLADWEAGQGRWAAAREAVKTAESISTNYAALPAWVRFVMAPVLAAPRANIDSLLREVETWSVPLQDSLTAEDRASLQRVPSPVEASAPSLVHFTLGYHSDIIPLYMAGLLESHKGEYQRALTYADSLEVLHPHRSGYTTALDFAHGIRADVLARNGNWEEALHVLDSAPWAVNHNEVLAAPIVGGAREVFLRARALQELERLDEALSLFTHVTEGGEYNLHLLAPSHLHRGEIYVAKSMPDSAAWHYRAFVELWKDADPEAQPLVEDVRQRIVGLESQ